MSVINQVVRKPSVRLPVPLENKFNGVNNRIMINFYVIGNFESVQIQEETVGINERIVNHHHRIHMRGLEHSQTATVVLSAVFMIEISEIAICNPCAVVRNFEEMYRNEVKRIENAVIRHEGRAIRNKTHQFAR
jgi:hypothetical protein